jgi:tyrosinase
LQVRKNQADLTPKEIQAFVDAVKQLKNTFREGSEISVYDEYVLVHMMAQSEHSSHEGAAFLPWHRALVRSLEMELQAINPAVTIPYWDFTVDNKPTSSIWSEQFLGGNGDPKLGFAVTTGPFRQGEWSPVFDGPDLRRQFGNWLEISLPAPDDVAGAFEVPRYDAPPYNASSPLHESFRNYVTGWNHPSGDSEMHNRVHEWVAGSMQTIASPNDPVFWLLHANIDRLWAQWQGIYGRQYEPVKGGAEGHNLHDIMPFVGVTPADMLDHRALGYDYAR